MLHVWRQEKKDTQNLADLKIIAKSLMMLQEEQEPGQELVFQGKNNKLSGSRQVLYTWRNKSM